ncbi:prefoldin subunit 1 [Pieris rapae]|uniref:prefoldin subunit 1 n=1 Tax=Pieris rapae TaxID=64459 RepID=UPI000B92B112|nr:prefoldin subunit 1 [Pieris rapae]
MSIPVDLELKKAFGELQLKMQSTKKKIHVIDSQIEVLKKVMRHVEVQSDTLPADTKAYESVGRMFLLTDIEEIKSNLETKVTQLSTRISELEESKQYLEKNLKESQDNIREMVQQRKVQSEKTA